MSKTMNILTYGTTAVCGVGLYLIGFATGLWATTQQDMENVAYQSAQIKRGIAIFEQEHDRRLAAQSRLDAIERALAEARTIHVERGADDMLSVSVIRTDKSGYEVSGRTLDVLIGGGNGR